jgi:hypothetical protein
MANRCLYGLTTNWLQNYKIKSALQGRVKTKGASFFRGTFWNIKRKITLL